MDYFCLKPIFIHSKKKTILFLNRLLKDALDVDEMVYLSLVLDYATLVLSCLGFYSLTAMLICVDNFMDATAYITGEVWK